MTNPHYAVRHSTDPHPVRPGTSDALFARTIDATQHAPLVRVQETVAALIPRVAAPLGSPLLISMLALTLVLLWVASRMRFRPSALLLSAVLVMALTSFRPMRTSESAQTPNQRIAEEPQSWMQFKDETNAPRAEPTPFAVEVSAPEDGSPPEEVSPPELPDQRKEPERPRDAYEPALPPVQITLPPEVRVQIPPAVMMMLQREEVRAAIKELQFSASPGGTRRASQSTVAELLAASPSQFLDHGSRQIFRTPDVRC